MNNVDVNEQENTQVDMENKEVSEETTEATESTSEDEELEKDDKLPFPNARVVRLMRESLDNHKQIKSIVKKEMNLFLGSIVKTICRKMNDFEYSYVDYGMFKQSIETFENIQTIELEKIRIIKALDKIKADCDVLTNDVERKFHT